MNECVLFPLVLAILGAGMVITVMSGDYVHWVSIGLALAVVGLASKSIR